MGITGVMPSELTNPYQQKPSPISADEFMGSMIIRNVFHDTGACGI